MLRPIASERPDAVALSDEAVVERVVAGDVALFEILMRRYNQRLYRIVRAILGDDDEAEDVAQDAYVRAFRELGRFRGEARFSTWLTRIAVHEATARLRRQRRFTPIDGGIADRSPATEPGPERDAGNRELALVLREAVDALPPSLGPVFVLREVEGLSSEDTAEALGISNANVRARLHRAKALLRSHLDARIGREARRLYLFDGARCDRLVEAVFAAL